MIVKYSNSDSFDKHIVTARDKRIEQIIREAAVVDKIRSLIETANTYDLWSFKLRLIMNEVIVASASAVEVGWEGVLI